MIKQQPFVNENIYVKIYLIREKDFSDKNKFHKTPSYRYKWSISKFLVTHIAKQTRKEDKQIEWNKHKINKQITHH